MKWTPVVLILWVSFLLGVLLAPIGELAAPTPLRFKYFDKVVHFGLFAITGLVSVLGASFLSRFKARVLLATAFGLLLAAGTEFAQSFIPHRSSDTFDLLADALGLGAALALCALLHRRRMFDRFLGT